MTASKIILFGAAMMILCLHFGCAGTTSGSGWGKGPVPPGVSKEVAARVDTVAEFLFVPREREKEAQRLTVQGSRNYAVTDSLWLVLDAVRKKNVNPTKPVADTTKGMGGNLNEQKVQAQSRNGTVDIVDRKMTIQASYHLLEARKNLEQALARDPFKPVTKHYLALTYKLFAERFPREASWERATEQWHDLAKLEPGEYLHHYNLGGVYYARQQWQKALDSFQKTEQLLTDYAEVSNPRIDNPALPRAAGRDTTRLFDAVLLQAESLIRLVIEKKQNGKTPEADLALQHLKHARELTSTPQEQTLVEANIKWINWDDRNIWGSAQRDTANMFASRGQFKEAADIYDELLQKLQNKRAKDDVRWDYATIAYMQLKRRAFAIERLAEVIQDVEQDSSGAPVDTTYNRMFENYGGMCYNLGLDTMKVDRKVAFQYFERGATVAWKERGRCFLYMADLAKTNPELSLENAEKALTQSNNFSVEEMKSVYRLLIDGYRRKNQMDKARSYMEKFREL